jgi:DNA-binding transcriptional ArsR family regulator
MLLGGDIILQVDDIQITGEESLHRLIAYLNEVQSTVTHRIRVLRAGEIVELRWISREFQPQVQ